MELHNKDWISLHDNHNWNRIFTQTMQTMQAIFIQRHISKLFLLNHLYCGNHDSVIKLMITRIMKISLRYVIIDLDVCTSSIKKHIVMWEVRKNIWTFWNIFYSKMNILINLVDIQLSDYWMEVILINPRRCSMSHRYSFAVMTCFNNSVFPMEITKIEMIIFANI